ncbi:MAG: tetratricopeptide repeat protein [Thermoguttaceae bacterium]|jgi:TolA-binding protein
MNHLKGTWMKALARAGWASVVGALFCFSAPLYGEENEAATRQYNVAVRLQNREAYDLAIDAWGSFLQAYPTDTRATQARHYQGVCQFFTAVSALDAKQTDAALKSFDAAAQSFDAVIKAAPKFELLEDTYLYLGLSQFKRAEIVPASMPAKQYAAAAATFDTLLRSYPQSKNLAQVLYTRGDCAYHAGEKADAVRFYSQALTKAPNEKLEPAIMYALGVAQEELKQWEAAGKTYDDYLKKYIAHRYANEIIMRRGETLFQIHQYQAAAEWFAAAAARPGFESADYATMRQAVALAQLGKHAEAGDILALVFTKFPNSTRLPVVLKTGHALARGLIRDKKPAEAIALVEKLLPRIEGQEVAAALAMDRADAAAAIPARRAESVALYASVANKFPKDPSAPQALYWAGYWAMTQGDYAGTVQYTDAFLAAYPTHELVPDIRYVAAESRLQLGKFDEAEKLYAELLQKYPQHPDAESWRVRQGTALNLQKKYPEVVALLQPVAGQIKNRDARAEAFFLIGSSLAEQKQFAEAVPSLEAAIAAAARWRQADETLLVLGQAYYQQKNAGKANETFKKLVAEFPQSKVLDRAHFRLGEYAAAVNDLKMAEAEYRLVVEKWPASSLGPYALRGLGWALFDQKEFAASEEVFNTLVEKYPDQKLKFRSLYARGLARHHLGKFVESVADLQALLTAGGIEMVEKSDARYVLGLSLVGQKKPAEAVATFRSLLSEDPKYAVADKVYYELAWALRSAGQEKEAVDAFAELIKQCPESPYVGESQFCVGEAAYKDGKFQAAVQAYAAALEKAGKSDLGEKSAHKLGWAYYRLDSAAEAQQAFSYQRAAWPRGPLAADAAFMEAECFFKQKKYSEALTAYERVKDTSSKDFQVLTLLHSAQGLDTLALAMLRPEQENQRKETWQKALGLLDRLVKENPDTPYLPEVLYERGWALQNLGRFEEAMGGYQQVLAKSNAEPAARSQFMIGQIQFQQKKHAEAVKSFYLVLYGYSYAQWQADAAFEAAKCFEALHKKSQAIKQYQELIEKFPQSDKVTAAKSRIEVLKRD